MAPHRDALLDALTNGATACSKRQAASRVTNLWKRLTLPSLVLSWYKNASPASSNFLKNSSQLISSRPFSFGPKSMRRIPACPFSSVAFTVAGTPSRSSAHFLIFLWSVVVWLSLICESTQDVCHQWDVLVSWHVTPLRSVRPECYDRQTWIVFFGSGEIAASESQQV